MAITFPRNLPGYKLVECTFDLLDNVSMSPSAKGRVLNRTQTVDPMWRAVIQTGPLEIDDRSIWSAWKKSLRGLRTFTAYDLLRAKPRAYQGASSPADIKAGWNGTAGVSSLGLAGALGLTGLPAAYIVKTGDRVGLEQSGFFGYYEVLEDVTANGAGAATLTVAPFLHTTVFTTAAVARIWQPKCQFGLDWQSWREQTVAVPTPVSFEAIQIL